MGTLLDKDTYYRLEHLSTTALLGIHKEVINVTECFCEVKNVLRFLKKKKSQNRTHTFQMEHYSLVSALLLTRTHRI